MRPKAMLNPSIPNPIAKLAGPHKLPKLLSLLPRNGLYSIIQPSYGTSPNFYLVTRSKLRFKAISPRAEDDKPFGRDNIPFGKLHAVPWKEVDPMEEGVDQGEMRVFGGPYCMRFKNGESGRVRA